MIRQTWPYGTRIPVTIRNIEEGDSFVGIVCQEIGNEKQAFVLLQRMDETDVEVNQHRTIVFTRGGPAGGYWKIDPAPSDRCEFPGRCLMPGPHNRSDCHTAEMVQQYEHQLRRWF